MGEETVFQYTYTSLQRQEVLKLRRQYLSYVAQDAKKQSPDAHTDETVWALQSSETKVTI